MVAVATPTGPVRISLTLAGRAPSRLVPGYDPVPVEADHPDDPDLGGSIPPPPEARSWRHPSELGAQGSAAETVIIAPRRRRRRRDAVVAAGAGLLGAGLAGGLLVLLLPGPGEGPGFVASPSDLGERTRSVITGTPRLAVTSSPDAASTPREDAPELLPAPVSAPGASASDEGANAAPVPESVPSDPGAPEPQSVDDSGPPTTMLASVDSSGPVESTDSDAHTGIGSATVSPPGDDQGSDPGTIPPGPSVARLVDSGALAVALTSDGILLTTAAAAGGVEDALEVELADGSRHLAVVVADGEGFALLQLDHPNADLATYELATIAPATGTWVTVHADEFRRGVVIETQGRLALAGMGTRGSGLEGAPVVDAQGRLVGLCTHHGGTTHLVPVLDAPSVAGARRDPAWLGIGVHTVTDDDDTRVVVTGITPASPALDLLAPGDIILALDEDQVSTALQLSRAVSQRLPGDVVTVSVERDGEPISIEVTLGVRPVDL